MNPKCAAEQPRLEPMCVREKMAKQNHQPTEACPACAENAADNRNSDNPQAASNGRPSAIAVSKEQISRLASQYTSCAGCSAAVKALLKRSIADLRLLNAVMDEDEYGNILRLRDEYVQNPSKTTQLLDTFPLSSVMKKVQPSGVSLRCVVHKRAPTAQSDWDWEDAWDRLPNELRRKVATLELSTLEAAMHRATAIHRFCADCKHNVVTACDILAEKVDLMDVENNDEFNPDLYRPFEGKVQEHGGKFVLECPLEEVEDLVAWYEDFDSKEYTSSGQRHAATLEHGQRELRSIVGSILLAQLRTTWHNHQAQVQAEQYLFCLVLHEIRTQMAYGKSPADETQNLADWIDEKDGAECASNGTLAAPGAGAVSAGVATKNKNKNRRKKEKRKAKKAQNNAQTPTNAHAGQSAAGTGTDGSSNDGDDGSSNLGQGQGSVSGDISDDISMLRRSCFDRNAEQRLLHSLYQQMLVEDEGLGQTGDGGGYGSGEGDLDDDDDIIREMEVLHMSVASNERDQQRQALRDTLQKRFQRLVDSNTTTISNIHSTSTHLPQNLGLYS